jgi:hypothetical protein
MATSAAADHHRADGTSRPESLQMTHRRSVAGVLALLFLMALGATMPLLVSRGAAVPMKLPARDARATRRAAAPRAEPDRATSVVITALGGIEHAFNAGDVRLLCRQGGPVDPAVLAAENAQPGGCEAELESLVGDEPPMRLVVHRITLRPDLATATVTTTKGASRRVDLVRGGHGWLLSFGDGSDPMPALTGAQ